MARSTKAAKKVRKATKVRTGGIARNGVSRLMRTTREHHTSTRALLLAEFIHRKAIEGGWGFVDYQYALSRLVSMLKSVDHRRTHLDPSKGGGR